MARIISYFVSLVVGVCMLLLSIQNSYCKDNIISESDSVGSVLENSLVDCIAPVAPTTKSIVVCKVNQDSQSNGTRIVVNEAIFSSVNDRIYFLWYYNKNDVDPFKVSYLNFIDYKVVNSVTLYVSIMDATINPYGCESERVAIPITFYNGPNIPELNSYFFNICRESNNKSVVITNYDPLNYYKLYSYTPHARVENFEGIVRSSSFYVGKWSGIDGQSWDYKITAYDANGCPSLNNVFAATMYVSPPPPNYLAQDIYNLNYHKQSLIPQSPPDGYTGGSYRVYDNNNNFLTEKPMSNNYFPLDETFRGVKIFYISYVSAMGCESSDKVMIIYHGLNWPYLRGETICQPSGLVTIMPAVFSGDIRGVNLSGWRIKLPDNTYGVIKEYTGSEKPDKYGNIYYLAQGSLVANLNSSVEISVQAFEYLQGSTAEQTLYANYYIQRGPVPDPVISPISPICPGEKATLNFVPSNYTTSYWVYENATATNPLTRIYSDENNLYTYITTNLDKPRTYYISQFRIGCGESKRIPFTVTVMDPVYQNFDGINDRVQIPAKSNYNIGSGDFTIEAEVSLNPSSDPYEPILSRRFKTGSVTDGFLLYEANGRILIQLNNANYFSDQFGNIRDNFLHKIAVVRNSGVLKFYLDGTFIGSANSFNSINTTAALYAGYDPYDQFFLNGTISNVHFWSVGKNVSELYQSNIPANAPGLLGNWKLNECAGQGVQDFGPLANHGVLGATMAIEASDPQRVPKSFTYGMQNALNLSSGSNNAKHGEIPNSGVYDFNQNFTIEAIIQGSNGAVSTFPSIFSKRNSSSDGFGFGIYNGRIYVSIGGTSYYDTNTGYNLYAYPGCVHVALTRRLVNGVPVFGVYVNGVLTYSFINRSNLNTSAPIWIGNDNGRNNVFNASIDEIRIWNVFKMPADLAANLNTTFNTSTPNLLGYYRFKEESHAQWLKDESAINNYGYLGSGTFSDGNDPMRTWLSCYGNSRISSNDIAIDSEPADTIEASASVYPNPFENTASLKIVNLDSDLSIQIIDAEGRIVYTKEKHPSTEELVIGEGLPQGMYIIHFVGQPVLKPIKFIKVF